MQKHGATRSVLCACMLVGRGGRRDLNSSARRAPPFNPLPSSQRAAPAHLLLPLTHAPIPKHPVSQKPVLQVFNAAAQSGAYHLPRLAAAGYGSLRVELVDESPDYVAPILDGYREVLAGRSPPGRLWSLLASVPDGNGRPGGVGGGSLDVKGERDAGGMRPTAATLKAAAAGGGGGGGRVGSR
jgi:hypothetical protein